MYVITEITGKVGGITAQALLDAGLPVRAVLRDAAKGAAWAVRGCEIALAEMTDAAALTAAFTGAEGVFMLIPPNFDPAPGFPEIRAIIAALTTALTAARPRQDRLPLHHRRAGHTAEPAHPTRAGGTGARCTATASVLPARGLVHGERRLGRRPGARGRGAELSAAARQARADGRHRRYRPPCRQAALKRTGRAGASSSWKARTASRPMRSRRRSPKSSAMRCAWSRCRAPAGKICSSCRGCAIPRRAHRCSMASTKAGSSSKGTRSERRNRYRDRAAPARGASLNSGS